MRMRILPRALWVAFSITRPSAIQKLLPSHLQLVPVAPLTDMAEDTLLFFNLYALQSRWMHGHRMDIQTYARDVNTGTPHLVVLDVLSDTMDWNPHDGIRAANADVSATRTGDIDMSFHTPHHTSCLMRVTGTPGDQRRLDYDFAVRANRKCYFRSYEHGFRMSFDDDNVMTPVRELTDVTVINELWTAYIDPLSAVGFFHEQEMVFDVNINPLSLEYKKLPSR